MSVALFRTTFKLSQWAIIAWAIFLILYGFLIMLLFPSIQETSGELLEDYMKSLPEGMREALNLTDEIVDELFDEAGLSLEGFLATEYLNWWPIIAGIYAFLFGSGIVAREVERGSMEFLLSQPIPRYQVAVTKFVAFVAIVGILVVASILGVALGLFTIDENADMVRVSLVMIQGGMVVISIAAYSLLLSCLLMDPRKAMTVAGGVTAALYILNLLGPALGSFEWLETLSLFYHFKPFDILLKGEFAISSVLFYLGVTGASFAAALLVFQRKKAVV